MLQNPFMSSVQIPKTQPTATCSCPATSTLNHAPTPDIYYLGTDHTSLKDRCRLCQSLKQTTSARRTGKLRQILPAVPETTLATRTLHRQLTHVTPSLSQCPPNTVSYSHSPPDHRVLLSNSGGDSQLGQRLVAGSLANQSDRCSLRPEVTLAARNLVHKEQKIKKETETKERNIHSTKTNSEIDT